MPAASYDLRYARAVKALVALNIFDGLATLALVGLKITVEKNPLMAYLLSQGPMTFGVVKFGLTAIIGIALWRVRRSPSAAWTLGYLLGIYAILVAYQLVVIATLLRIWFGV